MFTTMEITWKRVKGFRNTISYTSEIGTINRVYEISPRMCTGRTTYYAYQIVGDSIRYTTLAEAKFYAELLHKKNNAISLAEIYSGLKVGDTVIHKKATYTNFTEGQIVIGFTGVQDVLIQMPNGWVQKCNWKYVNKVRA